MSYLLDTVANQMLHQRELKHEKKEGQDQDQPEEMHGQKQQWSLDNYQHVQSSVCDKRHDMNQANSGTRRCHSTAIGSKKRVAKYRRVGEMEKLVSEQASLKLRRKNSARASSVQVHGGRLVQFFGQKEDHNKVSTLRGPRDRRVRLSAHTAIQFYDVQDRLGYDQPSKAIDWLIEKATAAIEGLAELRSQNDVSVDHNNSVMQAEKTLTEDSLCQLQRHQCWDGWPMKMENQQHLNETTKKNESIFSMAAGTPSCSSQLQEYPIEQSSTQGLFLSLQSSETQVFDHQHTSPIDFNEQALNSVSSLSELNSTDMGRFQSLVALDSCAENGGEEFFINSLPVILQQPLLYENQFFSQWGTLQSSNLFSFHASTDPPIGVNGHDNSQSPNSHLLSSKGFSSGGLFGI